MSSISAVALALVDGFSISLVVLFSVSLIYYIIFHFRAGVDYAVKCVGIMLFAVPVAFFVVSLFVFYLYKVLRSKASYIPEMVRRQIKKNIINNEAGVELSHAEFVTVHLVHGTFESNAPWTLAGSAMRKAIESLGYKVNFARFLWTGNNSTAARQSAAKALADNIANSPSSQHYIVAHSHGGNIVEMSLRRTDVAPKVLGVCLLSPPFIFRKMIHRTGGTFVFLMDFGAILAVPIPIAVTLLALKLVSPIAVLATAIVASFAWLKYSRKIENEYNAEPNFSSASWDSKVTQIFHAVGDEADSALRFVSFLHEACFGVLSKINAASNSTAIHINYLYLACCALFCAAIWCILEYPANLGHLLYAAWLGLFFIIIAWLWDFKWRPKSYDSAVLTAAALPVAAFAFWLGAAKAIAYGDLRLMFCHDIFITSSETPIGGHFVRKFEPESDGIMIHSTHSHAQVIRNVAAWLDSKWEVNQVPKS